jgi:hypothetical protein
VKKTTSKRQERTFDPDIFGQSQADLTSVRLEVRIASQGLFSVIAISIPNLCIHARVDQRLIFATLNWSDASNLSVSSGEIELSVLSLQGFIPFPDSIDNSGSGIRFSQPRNQIPSIISITGLWCFVMAMDSARQCFNRIAKHFSEDGHLFGRNRKRPPETLRREMENRKRINCQ